MTDEFQWCVSRNTHHRFLTGVINRICEAKLMKVNTTDTHRHTKINTDWGESGLAWFDPPFLFKLEELSALNLDRWL